MPLQASPQMLAALNVSGPVNAVVSSTSVTYLLLLGVIGSGVSTMAYIWLVLKRGPLFAGMTTYVVPVIALLWGTLDHEAISPMQAIAIAGVLGMVAIVQSGSKTGGEVLEPAMVGDPVTTLPLAIATERLVSLPMKDIAISDRRAVQPETQVA